MPKLHWIKRKHSKERIQLLLKRWAEASGGNDNMNWSLKATYIVAIIQGQRHKRREGTNLGRCEHAHTAG